MCVSWYYNFLLTAANIQINDQKDETNLIFLQFAARTFMSRSYHSNAVCILTYRRNPIFGNFKKLSNGGMHCSDALDQLGCGGFIGLAVCLLSANKDTSCCVF